MLPMSEYFPGVFVAQVTVGLPTGESMLMS